MSTLFSDDFTVDTEATNYVTKPDTASAVTIAGGTLNFVSNINPGWAVTTTSAHAAVADVTAKCTNAITTGFDAGPCVRANSGTDTMYYLDFTYDTPALALYRRVNASDSAALVEYDSGDFTRVATAVIGLKVSGTNPVVLEVFYNGTSLGTTNDSNAARIQAAGQTGVLSWHAGDKADLFVVEDAAGGGSSAKPGMTVNRGVARGINRGAVRYPTKR